MAIAIRRAVTDDFQGIVLLQSMYFVSNLREVERKEGFLSAEFSLSQIAQMADDLGVIVARDGGQVIAYMCASRVDCEPRPAILDAMFHCLEAVPFQGKPLTGISMFVYGPVCIDQRYRTMGLLRRMFTTLKDGLAGKFEIGVAFVAVDNRRSLEAHTNGLGMAKVGLFQYNGSAYHAVAFSVSD